MLPHVWITGPGGDYAQAVAKAGFSIVAEPPADVLITTNASADEAIAGAEAFAASLPHGQEALIVHVMHAGEANNWNTARDTTVLWAHVRHAALAWAPRRLRVNAIGVGINPAQFTQVPAATAKHLDVAAAVLAMWELVSMTGQIIRLG